jgi:hypothetical protein
MGPITSHEQLGAMLAWGWKRETPPLTYKRPQPICLRLADPTNEERRKNEGGTEMQVGRLGRGHNFGGFRCDFTGSRLGLSIHTN